MSQLLSACQTSPKSSRHLFSRRRIPAENNSRCLLVARPHGEMEGCGAALVLEPYVGALIIEEQLDQLCVAIVQGEVERSVAFDILKFF